jgi:large subunit ribosomal protein L4
MIKIIEKPVLPKELKSAKVNSKLLAQAVRVYQANQRQGTQSALTRAEVSRTRKKLHKQKGTGGARHGDRKAPIFVGGGIAFAPKSRDYSLNLPQKMRQMAKAGALQQHVARGTLFVASGLIKVEKTKDVAKVIEPGSLIVTDKIRENVYLASRNIPDVNVLPVSQLNALEVLRAGKVYLMEEAVPIFGEVQKVKKTEKK